MLLVSTFLTLLSSEDMCLQFSNIEDVTVYLILFKSRKAIDGRQRIVLPPGINRDDPLLVFLPTAGVHSGNDQKGWYYSTVELYTMYKSVTALSTHLLFKAL